MRLTGIRLGRALSQVSEREYGFEYPPHPCAVSEVEGEFAGLDREKRSRQRIIELTRRLGTVQLTDQPR